MAEVAPALPSADTEYASVVPREVQVGLAPIYSGGDKRESFDALVLRMAHEPLRLFNAVTQDLLSQFPHIAEMYPAHDDAMLHTLGYLNGEEVGVFKEPVQRGQPAPSIDNTMDDEPNGGEVT